MSNNYVKIKGRLGVEPEIRKTNDGKELVSLRVAVNDSYYDSEAKEWKDKHTEWFSCSGFKTIHVAEAKHLTKGSLVSIEGSLKNNEYTDKEGNKCYGVEVIINTLSEIVSRKSENQEAA